MAAIPVKLLIVLSFTLKNPSLDDKLCYQPSYFDSQGKLSPGFELE